MHHASLCSNFTDADLMPSAMFLMKGAGNTSSTALRLEEAQELAHLERTISMSLVCSCTSMLGSDATIACKWVTEQRCRHCRYSQHHDGVRYRLASHQQHGPNASSTPAGDLAAAKTAAS
jgi:hypothetical protein